jgi:hypothetical protein
MATTETTTRKLHTLTRAEHLAALTRRGLVPDPKTGRWGKPKAAKPATARKLPKVSPLSELVAPANPAAKVTVEWGTRKATILVPADDRRDTAASCVEALLHLLATMRSQEDMGTMLADYRELLEGDVTAVLGMLDEMKLLSETK